MEAAWPGAWRWSRVSLSSPSTEQERGGGGGSNPLQVRPTCDPNQRPPPPYLVGYSNYCGMSTTTTSGTASLSITTYTASTCASYSFPVVEEADEVTDEEKVRTREHIRDLILEFRGGDASSALDRWLTELRVSWVLHLAQLERASARRAFISRRFQYTARSWALALHAIRRSIVSFTGWCGHEMEEEEAASGFVGFVAATLLQMLPFVDILVALMYITDPSSDHSTVSGDGGAVEPAHKLQALADVREALSRASEQVQLWDSWASWLHSSPDAAEATRISGEMSSLLLAKLDKLDETIREAKDYIRTQSMSLMHGDDDDTWATSSGLHLSPSPDIHKATRSVISYIIVLLTSYDRPDDERTGSSIHQIVLMIRSLDKKLTRVSQSFQDQSLRLLFLINNFYFVWHQLRTNRLLDAPMQALTRMVQDYINSYLQVSWTPVLMPLQNHTLCCFMTHSAAAYAQRNKFESKFDKTYKAQKLWKVPDPELREELRTAIIEKVISAFATFLEDTGISASSEATPEKLEEMLEELFEG